jgi:putative ABC transport system permease protein
MLTHYLRVVLRTFGRSPLLSAINVLTLTLGLVCFLAAYGAVGYWNRAEQQFTNSSRTYVVTTNITLSGATPTAAGVRESNPYVAQYLAADFRAIEAAARVRRAYSPDLVASGDRVLKLFNASADPAFLDIFDLPFVRGDGRQALRQPRSAVLTRDAATRLFGTDDPIGRPLRIRNSIDVTVTGVVGSIAGPSHIGSSATAPLRFDVLTSMDVYDFFEARSRNPRAPPAPENWISGGVSTYVLLPANSSLSAPQLARQLPQFVLRHAPADQLNIASVELGLLPVTQLLSMENPATYFLSRTGLSTSTVFLLLGSLVLAVACLNYASLATARAASRTRDVGVRKALGASAAQIAAQHLFEAATSTAIALVIALALIAAAVPAAQATLGVDLGLAVFRNSTAWAQLVGVLVCVALAAGAYPALVLSQFRPAITLRAARLRVRRGTLVSALVGIQFAVASFLMIVLAVAYFQNQHLRQTGLNAAADPVLVIQNDPAITQVGPGLLRTELRALPQVSAVGYAAWSPWTIFHILTLSLSADASAAERPIFRYIVGDDFFTALQVPTIAGRALDSRYRDGPTLDGPWNIVVDRAFVDEFRLGTPENAIDRIVYVPERLTAAFGRSSPQPMRIVGVVETQPLAFQGLSDARSTIYTFGDRLPVLVARVSKNDVGGAVDAIDELWARLAPGLPMEKRFLDEAFNQRFESFRNFSEAFAAMTSLAIAISAIGLCSMAILVSSARVREIGVRKTYGASTWRMIVLLARSFSVPVIVANIVAWPFAFIAAKAYLAPFIYPIELTMLPFVACFAAMLLIAWIVIAAQTWRAAVSNPADVLRAD